MAARGHVCTRAIVDCCIDGRAFAELTPPVGIMLGLDDYGAEVIAGCRAAGLAVPSQVAVVGVNNDEVFCDLAEVPLSSVDLGIASVGYEAGVALAKLLAGETVAENRLVPPLAVVQRASSDTEVESDPVVAAARRHIAAHACTAMTVADLPPLLGVSRRTLETRFCDHLGRTPREEIDRVRFATAQDLLRTTDLPPTKVARRSGFNYINRFGTRFRQRPGVPPRVFRRQR